MARGKLTPILAELRGAIGDLVFRHYGDRVVVGRKPGSPAAPPSAAQIAYRRRFREASAYAKRVADDPDLRALYAPAAEARCLPVYNVALADYLKPPVIHTINTSSYTGARGDLIVVDAWDDFEVARVVVRLVDSAGDTIEEGEARLESGRTTYVVQHEVPPGATVRIVVRAWDRAGNVTEEALE
jgi:hypothetical protein